MKPHNHELATDQVVNGGSALVLGPWIGRWLSGDGLGKGQIRVGS